MSFAKINMKDKVRKGKSYLKWKENICKVYTGKNNLYTGLEMPHPSSLTR